MLLPTGLTQYPELSIVSLPNKGFIRSLAVSPRSNCHRGTASVLNEVLDGLEYAKGGVPPAEACRPKSRFLNPRL